jgi:hypothetical protein
MGPSGTCGGARCACARDCPRARGGCPPGRGTDESTRGGSLRASRDENPSITTGFDLRGGCLTEGDRLQDRRHRLGIVLYDGEQTVPFATRLFAAPVSCV